MIAMKIADATVRRHGDRRMCVSGDVSAYIDIRRDRGGDLVSALSSE